MALNVLMRTIKSSLTLMADDRTLWLYSNCPDQKCDPNDQMDLFTFFSWDHFALTDSLTLHVTVGWI